MKQWPLKILLVHPEAPYMQEEKLTFAADCSLLLNKDLVNQFDSETILIGCPMLEDPKRTFEKIKMIVRESNAKEIEVNSMEVPCCHALHLMTDKALQEAGKDKEIELKKNIVRVSGEVEPYTGRVDKSMMDAEARAHGGACGCSGGSHEQ